MYTQYLEYNINVKVEDKVDLCSSFLLSKMYYFCMVTLFIWSLYVYNPYLIHV